MAGFDRTGPMGQGSRTGRGLGKCNASTKGLENSGELKNNKYGMQGGRGKGKMNRFCRKNTL